MSLKIKRCLFYLAPMLVWMAVMFIMSSGAGSAANTNGRLLTLLRILFPDEVGRMNAEQLTLVYYTLRKLAHVGEYALLALLASRATRFWRRTKELVAIGGGFLVAVAYACTDEIHQSFVPGRTGALMDVGVDAVGAGIATALALLAYGSRKVEQRLESNG